MRLHCLRNISGQISVSARDIIFPLVIATLLCTFQVGCQQIPSRQESGTTVPGQRVARQQVPSNRQVEPTNRAEIHRVEQVAFVEEEIPLSTTETFSSTTSLDDLVRYALSHHPELQAARFRAEARMFEIPQALSLEDPKLKSTVFLDAIETAAGPQDFALSLSQRVPWFGKRPLDAELAYHGAQAAYSDLAQTELQVIEQVKLAYYDLYFLDHSIEIYKVLVERLGNVLSVAEIEVATNSKQSSLVKVLQAKLKISQLEMSEIQASQAKTKALARLAQAMGITEQASFNIKPQLETSNDRLQTVDHLLLLLEETHPELQKRRHEIDQGHAALHRACLDYYPNFEFGFNWYAIGDQGLSPVANGNDAFSLVVGMNLPIYRQKTAASVSQKEMSLAASRNNYASTLDRLQLEVETHYASFREHQSVLRLFDEDVLGKSKDAFDLSIEAFSVGGIDFQQLIDTYETHLRFKIKYEMHKASREQALAQLERAVGVTLTQGATASGP